MGSNQASILYFNGVDDKVDVQYNRELNAESFTVEAWAYSQQVADMERSVVTSRPASYRWGYMLYQTSIGLWEFWILNKVGDYQRIKGEKLTTNVWTHLAGTFDAATRTGRFYVNGNLANSTVLDYTPQSTLGKAHGEGDFNLFRIGAGSTESGYCSGGNYFFKGHIDEVRVWNKARTQEEINETMKKRLTGKEANLAGYWRLTDITDKKVPDLTGHGLDGNICNSSTSGKLIEPPFDDGGDKPSPEIPTDKTIGGTLNVPTNSESGGEFTNTYGEEITFTFSVSGQCKPGEFFPYYSYAGLKDFPYQPYATYPQNTCFALVAVNKATNTVIQEMSSSTINIVLKPGETLRFQINDIVGCYSDNVGNFTINWVAVIKG